MTSSANGLRERLRRTFWWLPFGPVPDIPPAELAGRLAANPPQLLDVRTALEWRRSRIPGAVSVPITELRRRLPSLALDPARPVVAICLSAHRSVPAVRLLRAHGYPDVTQLAGGMLAWWREELPTVGE
ncbi:MAG: rhodanese-like domain-containing protein [Gammaproteobacteria bacterium]|jgi:rhodanese-related sulfurtransferase|nr:rhodanese-like domain-containing protein [Gammaproteobacteria bacterium]